MHLKSPENKWFALSKRSRVIVASKTRVEENKIKRIEDLAKSEWKGRICSRPGSHVYNRALMASIIAAHGEEKAILAAQQAINSPLLQDSSIKGAKGLLVNITGPSDMSIHELNSASSIIYEEAGDEANVILGCVIDDSLKDEVRVTVIATGLNDSSTASIGGNINTEQMSFINKDRSTNQDGNNKTLTFGDNDFDVPTYLRTDRK